MLMHYLDLHSKVARDQNSKFCIKPMLRASLMVCHFSCKAILWLFLKSSTGLPNLQPKNALPRMEPSFHNIQKAVCHITQNGSDPKIKDHYQKENSSCGKNQLNRSNIVKTDVNCNYRPSLHDFRQNHWRCSKQAKLTLHMNQIELQQVS